MANIKISQLPVASSLDANTSNTVLVIFDKSTGSPTTKQVQLNVLGLGSSSDANAAFLQANAAFLKANTPSYTANSGSSYEIGKSTRLNSSHT